MFRIAIELPFMVLLAHRKMFKTEEAARRYITRYYKHFPAFAVVTNQYVESWNGNVFPFPAQRKVSHSHETSGRRFATHPNKGECNDGSSTVTP